MSPERCDKPGKPALYFEQSFNTPVGNMETVWKRPGQNQ